MKVNGVEKEINPGRGTTPIIQNGRTLLPIRAPVEEIGGSASWDEDEQGATLHSCASLLNIAKHRNIKWCKKSSRAFTGKKLDCTCF